MCSSLNQAVERQRCDEGHSACQDRNGQRRAQYAGGKRHGRSADDGVDDRDHRAEREIELPPRGLAEAHVRQHAIDVVVAAEQEVPSLTSRQLPIYLGLLHSIFEFAVRRGHATTNPCKLVDKPERPGQAPDIRYLDAAELNALVASVPRDARGPTETALYVAAAMTGLRQGELLGLRWRDIDWQAGKLRVRQSYVRGEFGAPKSRRSSRSVPLADEVAGQLDRHFKRSAFRDDDDLVFCHPQTGKPLDRSRLLKRFKAAARRAGLAEARFHDLRHTFGTRMAAAGVPLRTLQEWMGHRDFKTTLIYADYQPDAHERELVRRAFAQGPNWGPKLSETAGTADDRRPHSQAESDSS